MIETLIIINAGGICIYNKNFMSSKIDEQLLSGFLMAVSNFSGEVMKEGELQKIESKKQKIATYHDPDLDLTIAAIATSMDYDSLLLQVLKRILKEFDKQFHDQLDDPRISSFAEKFDATVEAILPQYVAERKNKQTLFGLIIGVALVIGLFFLQSSIFLKFVENYIKSSGHYSDIWSILVQFAIFSLQTQLIGLGSFSLPGFITGYIAGSRKKSLRIGFVLTIVLFILSIILFIVQIITAIRLPIFMIFSVGLFVLMITYIPLIVIIIFVFSYLGGLLKDKRKLYPLSVKKTVLNV